MVSGRGSGDGDGFDLNARIFRQSGDFDAGTGRKGRVVFGEERFINRVDGGEVIQILTKTIVLTMFFTCKPAASTIALTLSSDCRVC